MSRARLVLEAMRPAQWSKNVFVLAGLAFSGRALNGHAELRVWVVFLAFCLASGASYLINDVVDEQSDRLNPRTATRPIARGDLDPRFALAVAGPILAVAVALAFAVGWRAGAALCGFFALQLAYSFSLKHVLFVDVIALALGFVLRAYGGVAAVQVAVSGWFLLASGLLATFLALVKRRGELVSLNRVAHPQRRVLQQYTVPLIDELIGVVTPAVVVVYALYAVLGAHTQAMLATVPFVLYGIFRILYTIHRRSENVEEITLAVWRDVPLLLCVVAWGITAALIKALVV